MSIVNQPDVSINILPATGTISNAAQRVLFVGQKLAAGSAVAGELTENIGNSGEEDALFGKRSMLAQMIREARTLNKVTRFDAIALDDDAGGTAATGTVAFTGTATEDGSLTVKIGSGANYSFKVSIASGDTATEIGDALEAKVAEATNAPFTALNSTGTVTFTSSHNGETGNKITYKVDGNVAGVTTALTLPTNGADNPSLTNLFDVIEGERYQTIVYPNTYTLSILTNELDDRFNVNSDVLDGVGITTQTDTYANLVTAGNAENSKSLVILGNALLSDNQHKGGSLVEFDDVQSAKLAAIRSLRLTEDANISQYVISTGGARDSYGGAAIASLPYFNTPFPRLDLIPIGKGFSKTEIAGLKTAGISHLGNNKTRTTIIADEIVTTRKTDAAGNPEKTFKYLNTVDTSSNVREYFYNNLKSKFAQSRLTEGDLIPNRSMANKAVIEAALDSFYGDLSGVDYVLTQSGEAARLFFRNNRSVTLDMSEGKVTVNMQTPIVTQLRQMVATMQIAFSTEG